MLAREHNDANVVSVGGRMHDLDDMTRFVEDFLATPFTGDERHVRRIGQLADYEATGELPPLPASAAWAGAMPEGHTLRRLADELSAAFAGPPVRVSSPQGRFAPTPAALDGARAARRRLGRQAPVRRVRPATGSSTSTSG